MGSQRNEPAADEPGRNEAPEHDDDDGELTIGELDQVAGGGAHCTCRYVYGERGWFRKDDPYCPQHGVYT